MMKNGILTFLFAFCPGAGQMYQGYMKRGLSLITMFCVAFGASTLLEVLYVAMPIVWMYSFFDVIHQSLFSWHTKTNHIIEMEFIRESFESSQSIGSDLVCALFPENVILCRIFSFLVRNWVRHK